MDWGMLIAAVAFIVGYTIFSGKGNKNRDKPEWKETESKSQRKKKK
jgi:hypothetical protein